MPAIRPERSIVLLLSALLIVVIAGGSTYWLYRGQQRVNGWVQHTLRVEGQLSTLLSRIQAAESSQRGFMLSQHRAFLAPYEDFRAHWREEVDALRQEVRDNPAQKGAARRLERLIEDRLFLMRAGIDRRQRGEIISPADFETGRMAMDRLRAEIAAMKAREAKLLSERTRNANRLSTMVSLGMAVSAALVTLLGLMALLTAWRRGREASENERALSQANARLIAEARDRAAAQAQVRQMQKMESLGQLTGGIAHDFNNMLAIVIGSLDIVRRRLAPETDGRVLRSIDNAAEGAQRAAQLTARLLAFSRQQPLDPQPTDVNRLVGGMSDMLHRTLGETVRLETVLAAGLWQAHIDSGQLEAAILNLCVNARDAMPGGGRLTVETANAHLDDAYVLHHRDVEPGQYVMVSVTDSGAGMTPDIVERAFEPFFTTKGVGRGTGLGLSQVFGFTKQSRGHVKIYSEQGQGSIVKLYLPRHYGETIATGPAPTDPLTLPRARADEVILVVEDEERVRHMSVASLQELGYAIVQASDGEEALELLGQAKRIDMLFTDVVMPGINGRILADRARLARPDLRVLYTTGYTRNAIVHNGVLDPGVSFLPKPFTLDQLAAKVRQVLDAEGSTTGE